ncbi:hypothetical protein [uncultured Lentibacter sp.]|uniref:hypothetical protein n=1 Tax=uncultured Lentibacter sp. TaxID=1659309 RepID=UPI002601BB0B|nr:hypothetical protein [uncultured Lentibacter sp.]
MSIWTSEQRAVAASVPTRLHKSLHAGLRALGFGVVLGFLSACLPGALPGALASGGAGKSFALARAEIVPGRVVASGPPGFCIDRRSLKTGRNSGFALLAPCAALDSGALGLGLEAAILTIQVQPAQAPLAEISAAGLAQAFADEAPIYEEDAGDVSLVHLARGGAQPIPNGDEKHWRAALVVNGHLVGLAVYAEAGGVAAGRAGRALLLRFAKAIVAASPPST